MGNSRAVLIHWASDEAERVAEELRSAGREVRIETEDGGRACKLIKDDPPDFVVIDLTHRPSHGLRTARGLKEVKSTRNIPIVFLDGSEEWIAKAKVAFPDARRANSGSLASDLEREDAWESEPDQ